MLVLNVGFGHPVTSTGKIATFFRETNEKESSKETCLDDRIDFKTIVHLFCYLVYMPNCNEWIYYDGLKAPVYYLCGYIPGANIHDALSQKLLSFKNGNVQARQFWLDRFLSSYQHLFDKGENDFIIRSLSHKELEIEFEVDLKNPLGSLCYRISKAVNCRYASGMIYKLKVTPPLKGLSREARWDMVKDNYGLSQLFSQMNRKTVWFVDDIITSGATARATWKALLHWYPEVDFRVIALARTVREQDYNLNSTILNPEINEFNVLREEEETYFTSNLKSVPFKFDNRDTFFEL